MSLDGKSANCRWLVPTVTWRGWTGENPAGEQAVVLISDSRGRTWPTYGRVFNRRQSGFIHWEQSIIPLHDGRMLAVAWVHDPSTGTNLPTPYTFGQDCGETWSSPQLTGLQGHTCKGIQLKDGRIFCAYRHNEKPGLWGNLSEMDRESRINHAEIPIWQGASSGMAGVRRSADELSALRFGYPSIQQLPYGDIFLLFWCVEELVTLIRWVRVRVDSL